MKIIKSMLKNSLIACSLICFTVRTLQSMETSSVQKHLNWLRTVNREAHGDAATLVKDMCYVSRYLGDYREYHCLKKPERALEHLSATRSVLAKIAMNVGALCSNKQDPALITGYKVMDTLQGSNENDGTLTKACNVFNTLRPQSLSIGQTLTAALEYLDADCSRLKGELEKFKAPASISALQKLSYNTQLLFSAFSGKEILERFTIKNSCQDEVFYRMVQKIVSSYAQPRAKTIEEVDTQKERQKAYVDWIRKTFYAPIEIGVKTMGEIGAQPNLSDVARLLLSPQRYERVGISLAEKSGWLRNRMGSNGAAIGKAMDEGKPITGIMRDLEKGFPTALRPLTLSLLKNYGQTVINPLIYFMCLSRFPLSFLINKTNTELRDLDTCETLPSLEDQLYPYLSTLGSSFYEEVQGVLNEDNHKNQNKFEEKSELKNDFLLMKKRSCLENKLSEAKVLCDNAQNSYRESKKRLFEIKAENDQLNGSAEKYKSLEKKLIIIKNKEKEVNVQFQEYLKEKNEAAHDALMSGASAKETENRLKRVDEKYRAVIYKHNQTKISIANVNKELEGKNKLSIQVEADYKQEQTYFEDIQQAIKRYLDECLTLERKLKIIDDILQKRGYKLSDFQKEKKVLDPELKKISLCRLNYGCELRRNQLHLLNDRIGKKLNQLQEWQKAVQQNETLIGQIKNTNPNRVKELDDEIIFFKAHNERLQKKKDKAENKRKRCEDEIKKYEEVIHYKEKLQLLRDFLSNNYLQNLFKDTVISDQNFRYIEELVVLNYKEFHKVIKKMYKKNSSLGENDAQNIFNAWVLYLLDRQKDYQDKKIRSEYENLLHDIARTHNDTEIEREIYRQKDIRDVWSSYTLSMKLAAWITYFRKGCFPVYTDHFDTRIKYQENIYQQCLESYEARCNKGSFRLLHGALSNEALLNQRQVQHNNYMLIKFLLDDGIKTLPYLEALKNIQFKKEELKKEAPKTIKTSVINKDVESQTGAKCGEHAVFNALKSMNLLDINLEEFLRQSKDIIVEERQKNNDCQWMGHEHWLSEDEITMLLNHYAKQKPEIHDSVIFLPDVTKYLMGLGGLDQEAIRQIAEVHHLIDNNEDFNRAYIICTAGEKNSYRGGKYDSSHESERNGAHWIAIKQKGKNGKLQHEIMDSSPGANIEELKKNFIKLMKEVRGFTKISDMQSQRYEKLLSEIGFSKAIYDGYYAMKTKNRELFSVNNYYEKPQQQLCSHWIDRVFRQDNPVEINEVPVRLVDRILDACISLLDATKGELFHCVVGRIEPLVTVQKVIEVLKNRHHQNSLHLLNYLEDYTEEHKPQSFQLTEEQKHIINTIEEKIGQLEHTHQ